MRLGKLLRVMLRRETPKEREERKLRAAIKSARKLSHKRGERSFSDKFSHDNQGGGYA